MELVDSCDQDFDGEEARAAGDGSVGVIELLGRGREAVGEQQSLWDGGVVDWNVKLTLCKFSASSPSEILLLLLDGSLALLLDGALHRERLEVDVQRGLAVEKMILVWRLGLAPFGRLARGDSLLGRTESRYLGDMTEVATRSSRETDCLSESSPRQLLPCTQAVDKPDEDLVDGSMQLLREPRFEVEPSLLGLGRDRFVPAKTVGDAMNVHVYADSCFNPDRVEVEDRNLWSASVDCEERRWGCVSYNDAGEPTHGGRLARRRRACLGV